MYYKKKGTLTFLVSRVTGEGGGMRRRRRRYSIQFASKQKNESAAAAWSRRASFPSSLLTHCTDVDLLLYNSAA